MNKVLCSYYIGLNDKDSHTQDITTQEALNIIEEVMDSAGIDSYTTSIVQGHYKNELENTIKLDIVGVALSQYYINLIKGRLNQECIMELCSEVDCNFI